MQIQVNIEELRKNKLFVATPMYGGMSHGLYVKSCLDLQTVMMRYGIEVKFSFLFNESLITRARNYLVDEFLRTDFTHMLFIDSDIHFDPNDIVALMALDKDVIGGPYPKKSINWNNIAETARKNPDLNPKELENLVGEYVFNVVKGTQQFQVSEPLANDLACYTWLNSTLVQGRYVQQEANYLKLLLYNYGVDTVFAAGISYSVNGAEDVYELLVGLTIPPYESAVVSHPIPWIPASDGFYNIDFTIVTVNGYEDEDTLNNRASAQYEVGPGIPNVLENYLFGVPTYTTIANASNSLSQPTDLDFHPRLSSKQLWVVNQGTENTGGSTVTITNTGQGNQITELLQDGNAWHFMSLPTGIAFSDNDNFATSPGVFDANHAGTANAFTGPTLWSSDPQIYAQPSGGNGSHIDMLHESPNSQGICWEKDNTFWLFDMSG